MDNSIKEKLKIGVSEDTISAEMEKRWFEEDIDESKVPLERVDNLYKKIQRELTRHKRTTNWMRWAGIAAAIILPLCVYFTISKYSEIREQSGQELLISTANGEQSSITLPDGTSVKLNEMSKLKYSPGKFGTKKREISFEGEGYFQVAAKDDCPFIIDADKMTVTVLGTIFNLRARMEDSINKLYLVEGRVMLFSSLTGETVTLSPLEEATLDKITGKMSVVKNESYEKETSWTRKELVVKGISLKEVLNLLNSAYGVEFSTTKNVDTKELFTGTLPTDDILACTEILEYAYGVKIKISGSKALISK